jgi:hypothetical protein
LSVNFSFKEFCCKEYYNKRVIVGGQRNVMGGSLENKEMTQHFSAVGNKTIGKVDNAGVRVENA